MKTVGIFTIGLSMLVLGTTAACTVEVPEQGQNDEATSVDATSLTSVRATPETERLTGVFAWEVQKIEHDFLVNGLDRQGSVVVSQKTAVGADGSLAVEVTHPSLYKFTVDASGNKVELAEATPQVRLLFERAALDLAENQANEAEMQEYSAACFNAYFATVACAAATAGCIAVAGATLGVGIVTCFGTGTTCGYASYCNYRCTNGFKSCDGSATDNQYESSSSGCDTNDMNCDGIPDDSGGSNDSGGSDSGGNYGE